MAGSSYCLADPAECERSAVRNDHTVYLYSSVPAYVDAYHYAVSYGRAAPSADDDPRAAEIPPAEAPADRHPGVADRAGAESSVPSCSDPRS